MAICAYCKEPLIIQIWVSLDHKDQINHSFTPSLKPKIVLVSETDQLNYYIDEDTLGLGLSADKELQ